MFDLSVAPQNIVSNEDLQSHLILKARNGIVVNNSPRSTPIEGKSDTSMFKNQVVVRLNETADEM